MSSTTTAAPPGAGNADAHGHDHDPAAHLAHHFDTSNQQFDAGKMGIWLFLVTEVLFFSGLFCAYSIWRSQHPEIFLYAHHYLDTKWGAINTGVLLFSSLTAAWSVRCAQLNNQKGLILTLLLTIACAFGFLGIKYVEYNAKVHHGTVFGQYYKPHADSVVVTDDNYKVFVGIAGDLAARELAIEQGMSADTPRSEFSEEAISARSVEILAQHEAEPPAVKTFFSIYFAMTGLHGIHVIAGIIAYLWILKRALAGTFSSKFYGPVDFVALYWHLVDLVWIYLFPLLYLIN